MPEELVKQVIDNKPKSTGRGGKHNFPNAQPPEDPEDVQRVLSSCLRWYDVGSVKVTTDDEVEQRTRQYFQECLNSRERPTVECYCMALGYTRQTINEWEHGNGRRADIIKKAKEFLASYDAGLVAVGKLNPVPYIFRAKNYYGMRDTQDIVVTPNNPVGGAEDTPEIAQKYLESAQTDL